MIRFSKFIKEAFDTVHPHKLTKNEVDEFDIIRDEEDRPIGVSGRSLHHEFDDPHSGDKINVKHDIRHHIDDYDPKNPKATQIEISFTRSPGEGSTENTYQRVKGGKGTLGIFSTVSHITDNIVKKHGKGETMVTSTAENERVPSYSRMMQRKSGVAPDVYKYPDSHPMAGYSRLSFTVPKQ